MMAPIKMYYSGLDGELLFTSYWLWISGPLKGGGERASRIEQFLKFIQVMKI